MQGEADVLGEMLGRSRVAAVAAPVAAAPLPTQPGWQPWPTLVAAPLLAAACLLGAGKAFVWLGGNAATPWGTALAELSTYLPLLVVALLGAWLTRSPGLRLGTKSGSWSAVGAAAGGGTLLAAVSLAWAAGTVVGGSAVATGLGLLAGGLAITLVQSAAEEALLRGWLQPKLAQYWRGWIAVAVTAVLFAGLHLIAGARTPLTLVNLVLGGVLFGLLALRSGGLAAPVAAHFVYNLGEQSLLGLSPNPGTGAFGAIVDLDLHGAASWGGSSEGLNASLALSFALLASIAALAKRR